MGRSALAFARIDMQRVFAFIVTVSWFVLVSSIDCSDSLVPVLWSALCFAVFLVWILCLNTSADPSMGKSQWWMGISLMGDGSFQKKKSWKKGVSWNHLCIFGIDISPDVKREWERIKKNPMHGWYLPASELSCSFCQHRLLCWFIQKLRWWRDKTKTDDSP